MFQQNVGLSRSEEPNSRGRPNDAESSTRLQISLEPLRKTLELHNWRLADFSVYAALNQPDLALSFAKTALEVSQKNNLSERLISAYEGMARAYAVAKRYPSAREFVNKAREQLRVSSLDD